MAKNKVRIEAANVVTLDDVEAALQRVGTLEEKIREQEAQYNQDELQRRAVLTAELQPLRDEIERYAQGLRLWGESNRVEFGKKRSMPLQHGLIGFRTSPPAVKTIKGITAAAAFDLVKRSPFGKLYVRLKEELAKDQILADVAAQTLNEQDLAPLGLRIEQEEVFFYETKLAVEGK